jgi:glucokinase
MFLGIEIGGTKIQLGVGNGDGPELAELVRTDVVAGDGAAGILVQIEREVARLLQRHRVSRIGVGFGGPVDPATGRVIKSHQIDGWDDFALATWCRRTFGIEAAIDNDCNVAALAEARWGAGADRSPVFYVTVGTGVGGGLIADGRIYGADRPAVAEIGHLRPGLLADRPDATVESIASGWGIAAAAQARLSGDVSRSLTTLLRTDDSVRTRLEMEQRLKDLDQADEEFAADLLSRCDADPDRLTAKMVAQAASEGNEIAAEILQHAIQTLGWAIAQTITLMAPRVVVVGGGVSLMPTHLFLQPLRREVERYVFPPLAGTFQLARAKLGEAVVVHGAIALAADFHNPSTSLIE